MDITVSVVAYNAAECIRDCLQSLLNLMPHHGALEILVIDGCSTDNTQSIVNEFRDQVRLVENRKRTIASNRNVALREASYPFIAFTDADCTVPPYWLSMLEQGMMDILKTDPFVAGVGGGNVAVESNDSPFHLALGTALDSFLGSLGSVQGRVFNERRPVTSLAALNVLYKRSVLETIGGFDEELANMCEDADINYRLTQQGFTLHFLSGANVRHHARPNYSAWCRNMYAYGQGRARIIRKHRTIFSMEYALALGFLPTFVAGSVAGVFWPWIWLVWLYVPMIFGAGLALAYPKKNVSGLMVALILLGTHFCYAVGLWSDFFLHRKHRFSSMDGKK